MQHPDDFDPFAPTTFASPYAFYASLRREAPVYPLARVGYSLVSRYEDCRAVALAPDAFSSKLVAFVLAGAGGGAALVSLPDDAPRPVDVLAIADEPDHARQRKLSNRAFAIRRVTDLEPSLRLLATELVDGVLAEGGGEWMGAVANEMPTRVICDLIGLPQADRDRLRSWANDGSALLSGVLEPAQLERYAGSVIELNGYLAERLAEAEAAPRDDVLGDFVRASGAGADSLGRDEIVAILVQLLAAGSESTTALLGSAVLLLGRDPVLQQRLRDQPGLIGRFVEEACRLESPFQGHFRVARDDTAIGGESIAAGTRLMLMWGSANRDERQFEDPERVDVDRANLNMHLGFGFGIHHCIGAALARWEARVVLEELLSRTTTITVEADQALDYIPSVMIRRLRKLNVETASNAR